MKTRRHHNNKGRRTVTSGKTREQVRYIARRLGIPLAGDAASRHGVSTMEHAATTSASAAPENHSRPPETK